MPGDITQCPHCYGTGDEPDAYNLKNEPDPKCHICMGLGTVPLKCPECLGVTTQHELDTFGGLCENCTGTFNE